MNILGDREQMLALDASNMLSSIEQLQHQVEHAWQTVTGLDLNIPSEPVSSVHFIGMGGSALGAYVVKALYGEELPYSFEVINNYVIPKYANSESLIILSSYSGTTEEVLTAARQAKQIGAYVVVIAAGGELIELAKEYSWPYYLIDPKFNASKQPRMAVGYAMVGLMGILSRLGILPVTHADMVKVIAMLGRHASQLAPENTDHNRAKALAELCLDKHIILASADHLVGGMHVFNNQINENAKHLTTELRVPELNHHYLEALSFPEDLIDRHILIVAQSTLYKPQNTQRVIHTQAIFAKAGMPTFMYEATSETKLEQVFELIQFSAYTNYYLSMLHGIDPAPIPNVDHFKELMRG